MRHKRGGAGVLVRHRYRMGVAVVYAQLSSARRPRGGRPRGKSAVVSRVRAVECEFLSHQVVGLARPGLLMTHELQS